MLEFTEQLMNIAFRAFIYKKCEPLKRPAELLMRLPYPHSAIGKYYMGVYLTRSGQQVESLSFLEQAGLEAPQAFQARAIACMGAMAKDEGESELACTLYGEAIRAARWRSGSDDFTRLSVRQCLAIMSASVGESELALATFLDLLSETAANAKGWPILYLNLLNGIAMELMVANRLDEAGRVLDVVLNSPYRWDCWLDTAVQLQSRMSDSGRAGCSVLRFSSNRFLSETKPEEPEPVRLDGRTRLEGLPPKRWPESLIKGCSLRGRLEAISFLLDIGLTDEENDKLLDLLTTLWFDTGTWV
ncbi:MAG: hypothetical protein ACREDR_23325 [Blastocatellia bacterium]